MFERFILPLLTGVAGSLIAHWITSSWGQLSDRNRWLVSGVFGVLIGIAVAVVARRPKPNLSRAADVLSDLDAAELEVDGLEVAHHPDRTTSVISRDTVKGKLTAKNIKVGTRGEDK